jgi:hypothetical protein
MDRMPRRSLHAVGFIYWAALTVLLGIAGWLTLFACGIRVFGYEIQFCPAVAQAPSDGQARDIAALHRRVQDLERTLGERPLCPREVSVPQAPAPRSSDDPAVRSRSAESRDECTQSREDPVTTVVVLDGSRSMMLPYDINPERDRDLTTQLTQPGLSPERTREVNAEYDSALAAPGRQRIDRGRDAALDLLGQAGPSAAAVVFQDCNTIESGTGLVAAERVRGLVPRGGTPIAAALSRAAALVPAAASGRRDATIVLITDGSESCGGDPCATARAIKLENPGIVINVVDIAGWTEIACVARETGGIVRRGGGDIDLTSLTRIAAKSRTVGSCQASIEKLR